MIHVHRVRTLYNGRLITAQESKRIKDSQKEDTSMLLQTTEDVVEKASTIVFNHLSKDMKIRVEKNKKEDQTLLQDADNDFKSSKTRRKERKDREKESNDREDGDDQEDREEGKVGISLHRSPVFMHRWRKRRTISTWTVRNYDHFNVYD